MGVLASSGGLLAGTVSYSFFRRKGAFVILVEGRDLYGKFQFAILMSIPDGNGCVSYLKALSDETRWEIVRILSNTTSSLTLGEIAERLELSSYNASKHVRILNEAGLICVVRDGRFKRIGIAPEWRSTVKPASTPGTLDLGCCCFDFSRQGLKVRKT